MEISISDGRMKELFEELQWQMAQTDLITKLHSQSNDHFTQRDWREARNATEVGGGRQSSARFEENGLTTLRGKLKDIFLARGIEGATAVRVVFDNGDRVLIETLDDAALDRTDPIQKTDIISSAAAGLPLAKLKNMRIKIYQEKRHPLPHIHIDYGQENHVASFSIETGKRIEGTLSPEYDKDIEAWLSKRKGKVLTIWRVMQSGGDPRSLIIELQGNA